MGQRLPSIAEIWFLKKLIGERAIEVQPLKYTGKKKKTTRTANFLITDCLTVE